MNTVEKQSGCYFYGLQSRPFSPDRLYRVHVCDKMIAGAYVAGQFYDERSAAAQLQQLYPLLFLLVCRGLARRKEREAFYDTVDPFDCGLTAFDERNFQISRPEVVHTRLQRNRNFRAVFNAGTVELELLEGKPLRLILVADQDQDEVLKTMRIFDPAIEVTGKPRPRRFPKPVSPQKQRAARAILGFMLLLFGGFLPVVALDGVFPLRLSMPAIIYQVVIGAVSAVVGVVTLARALKKPTPPPKPEEPAKLKDAA